MTFYESVGQWRALVYIMCVGAATGLLADMGWLAARVLPRAAVIALDVLLCVCSALACAYGMVTLGTGEFRLYALLCAGAGLCAYVFCLRLSVRALFLTMNKKLSANKKENAVIRRRIHD